MIDTTEQNKWLKNWIKEDLDNLGTDLETRTFTSLEVEIIMKIYSLELLKIQSSSNQNSCDTIFEIASKFDNQLIKKQKL